MRVIHAILVEPKDNDNAELSAFLRTRIHFVIGALLKAEPDPDRAVMIAKRYEKNHPNMKCSIVPFSFEEAQQLGTAAFVEKMFTDAEFMKGVD